MRKLRADEIDCFCSEDGIIYDDQMNPLKVYKTPNGYCQVLIKAGGKWKKYFVHRIIAKCFIDNPFNKPCVNHKDGDKSNNSVSNLEWCTYSENELHSHRVLGKRISEEHLRYMWKKHKEKSQVSVFQISKDGEVISRFDSMSDAHRITGISQGNISECCNGTRKSAGGYVWKKCSDF